jgi:hypothetical protein
VSETLYLREPERLNHKIKKNAGWIWHLEFSQNGQPFDLTGYTVRCSFVDDAGNVVLTPTVTIMDAAAGILELSLTKAQTTGNAPGSLGSVPLNYDLFLDIGADSIPIFEGVIEPMPGYTP